MINNDDSDFDFTTALSLLPQSGQALQDFDGDGVVSTKDIVVYIIICLLVGISAYLK